MILLAATTDKLQLITSAAVTVDVCCSYVDYSSSFAVTGMNKSNTAISTATTTDIVPAPSGTNIRNVKQMTARNKGSAAVDVTVQYNQNATLFEMHKQTLNPGEMLEFVEGVGFFVVTAITSSRLITAVEQDTALRVFRSTLLTHSFATVGGFLTISGTAYYVYIGRVVQATTVAFVEFHVTTAAGGTQTAEVGLFSTPASPNKSAQTLTKIAATGTLTALTGTGMNRNSTTFAQVIPAGTHLWAAARFAMATTQPTTYGIEGDMSEGHVLTTTGGGALTSVTTASGALVAIGTGMIAPDLRITLD